MDYWENRKNPPNLLYDDFKNIIDRFETIENLRWVSRESEQGAYGKSGEDYCFKFEGEVALFTEYAQGITWSARGSSIPEPAKLVKLSIII